MRFHQYYPEGEIKPFQWGEPQNIQVRPGRLEPLSKVTTSWAMIRAQTSTPSRMDLWPERIVSVQRRAEMLPELGRPAQEMSVEQTAFCTDLQRASGASNRRRWIGGVTPRPAGLGEAAKPDFVTPRVQPLRGSQAPPLTSVQLALPEIPAENRPWSTIYRTPSPHFKP